MRKLILAAIAALFATMTASAFAGDPVQTDPAKSAAKPGRAIDEGSAVKTDPGKAAAKPGRAADEPAPSDGGKKKKKGKKKKTEGQ